MLALKRISRLSERTWAIMKSPRMVALIKVGIALVGVVQAIEELRDVPGAAKTRIGFQPRPEDEASED